jgi:hypothetical protein
MNELDEVWTQMMQNAIRSAHSTGRTDVAEYLTLKARNDQIRATSCRWLFESFTELSDEVNRKGIRLNIENQNPHRFAVGNATMVGSLISFHHGLRNLTVEAGWTRTPQDGFIRGGGLACARISHFGMSKHNAELILVRSNENVPQWFSVTKEGKRSPISSDSLREHFNLFLDLR